MQVVHAVSETLFVATIPNGRLLEFAFVRALLRYAADAWRQVEPGEQRR